MRVFIMEILDNSQRGEGGCSSVFVLIVLPWLHKLFENLR